MKLDCIWMVQVTDKRRTRRPMRWSATTREWFGTRREALKYISTEIAKENFSAYQYRVTKYVAIR